MNIVLWYMCVGGLISAGVCCLFGGLVFEIKITLFEDDMIAHISYQIYPKNSTRELLQLINNFNKVSRYKINSNKLVVFLYTG